MSTGRAPASEARRRRRPRRGRSAAGRGGGGRRGARLLVGRPLDVQRGRRHARLPRLVVPGRRDPAKGAASAPSSAWTRATTCDGWCSPAEVVERHADDDLSPADAAALAQAGFTSRIDVPLLAGAEVLGVLSLAERRSRAAALGRGARAARVARPPGRRGAALRAPVRGGGRAGRAGWPTCSPPGRRSHRGALGGRHRRRRARRGCRPGARRDVRRPRCTCGATTARSRAAGSRRRGGSAPRTCAADAVAQAGRRPEPAGAGTRGRRQGATGRAAVRRRARRSATWSSRAPLRRQFRPQEVELVDAAGRAGRHRPRSVRARSARCRSRVGDRQRERAVQPLVLLRAAVRRGGAGPPLPPAARPGRGGARRGSSSWRRTGRRSATPCWRRSRASCSPACATRWTSPAGSAAAAFALLLPSTPPGTAAARARGRAHPRAVAGTHPRTTRPGELGRFTMSLGVGRLP